jgi:hypothetical protein
VRGRARATPISSITPWGPILGKRHRHVEKECRTIGCIMRKSSLASAAILFLINASWSCFAADLSRPVYPRPAAPPMPFYSWNGFYVGANVGGAWAWRAGGVDSPPPLYIALMQQTRKETRAARVHHAPAATRDRA